MTEVIVARDSPVDVLAVTGRWDDGKMVTGVRDVGKGRWSDRSEGRWIDRLVDGQMDD